MPVTPLRQRMSDATTMRYLHWLPDKPGQEGVLDLLVRLPEVSS